MYPYSIQQEINKDSITIIINNEIQKKKKELATFKLQNLYTSKYKNKQEIINFFKKEYDNEIYRTYFEKLFQASTSTQEKDIKKRIQASTQAIINI